MVIQHLYLIDAGIMTDLNLPEAMVGDGAFEDPPDIEIIEDPVAISLGRDDDSFEHYQTAGWLLFLGIVTTLIGVSSSWTSRLTEVVGVSSTWTSGDVTVRRLLEGPSNGWIPLLASVLALLVSARFVRGRWPAIFTVALIATGAAARVLGSQALDNFDRTWGWWVGLVGAVLLIAAAGVASFTRVRLRKETKLFELPTTVKQIVGLAGLTVVIVGLYVMGEILQTEEIVSWPPSADAVDADEALAATASFAAVPSDPQDVSIEYAWSTANTIDVYVEGVEFFPRIFADIEAAESSVHIIMYGWKSGEVGTELAELLESKLSEGVEVRILVDAVGSGPYSVSNEMYTSLVSAGAEIVVNDTLPLDADAAAALQIPVSNSTGDEVGRVEHRKLYVVDGEIAWTGGAGIEDHFRNGEFHDVMGRVTGGVVRQSQAAFLTSFASHDAELPDDLSVYFPEPSMAGAIPATIVQTVPGGFSSATQQAREMIDESQERLDIMNPYLTDEDIVRRIVEASERGVDVRVLVSKQSNNAAAQSASSHFYPRLLDAGVEVWEYPDAVVHAKVIVADDVVHFGTLNLDAWSLYRDFEIAVVAEDAPTAAMFRERIFDPDIAISTLAVEPPLGQRFKNWAYYKLTWFL